MVANFKTETFNDAERAQLAQQEQPTRHPQQKVHFSLAELPLMRLNPRFSGKVFEGEQLSVICSEAQPGFTVPKHKHDNEQVTIVQSGCWRFNVGGEEFVARAGDIVHVPAGWEHSGVCLEQSSVIDIFTPPRQDWSDDMDDYLWGI